MLDQITTRMKCNLVIIDTVRKVTVLQIVVSLLTTNVPIGWHFDLESWKIILTSH